MEIFAPEWKKSPKFEGEMSNPVGLPDTPLPLGENHWQVHYIPNQKHLLIINSTAMMAVDRKELKLVLSKKLLFLSKNGNFQSTAVKVFKLATPVPWKDDIVFRETAPHFSQCDPENLDEDTVSLYKLM